MKRALLRRTDGSGFRLLMPDQSYRDFHGGLLTVDDADPDFDWLIEWAQSQPDMQIYVGGQLIQRGERVCAICWEPVADDDAEAAHIADRHVPKPDADNLESEEPGPPIRRTRRR